MHIIREKEDCMLHTRKQHKNAKLTPLVRQAMISQIKAGKLSQLEAGDRYGVHRNTVAKWYKDAQDNGNWLCLDKRSTPEKYRVSSGLKMVAKISEQIGRRIERKRMLYSREHLGELVHIDTKKLPYLEGQGAVNGKEYLFVGVDDASRYAYAAIFDNKSDEASASFLEEFLTVTPVPVQAIMTDNGKEYRGRVERGHLFESLLEAEHIKHIYTKVRTPKTNGKAERMIRTIMMWHCLIKFSSKEERSYLLSDFIEWYNTKKGHSSLKGQTPLEWIGDHYKNCENCTQRLGS